MGAEPRSGTSLIELLVVLAILAVLAGAVALSVGLARPPPPAERELDRFARALSLACERARLTGLVHGVLLDREGYVFAFDDGSGWLRYAARDEVRLAPRPWGEDLRPEVFRDGRPLLLPERAEDPQLACAPSGELTPFELRLGESGGRGARLTGAAMGRLERDGGDRR